MKLVFICQAVDEKDPVLASTVRWIKEFARRPQVERMTVIALRVGEFHLPDKVQVHAIREKSRLLTLLHFYRIVFRALAQGTDSFFVHMGGWYPILLLPFKLLLGKPIYHWKAHPHINRVMRFSARFCDTKIFTATPHSFPLPLAQVRVLGHGIDTSQFHVGARPKKGDLVTVGRVAPSKQIDLMLKALARCNYRYGTAYRLDVYGPTLGMDQDYRVRLDALVAEMDSGASVAFKGAVRREQLPELLNGYRLFLSFSQTALDKSTVEAMACGLPVLSTNPCVEEILPEAQRSALMVLQADVDLLAEAIHRLLSLQDEQLSAMGQALRKVAVRDHSLVSLVDKMLAEMVS